MNVVSSITPGTAPDSRGVWFPDDPDRVSADVFLAESAEVRLGNRP